MGADGASIDHIGSRTQPLTNGRENLHPAAGGRRGRRPIAVAIGRQGSPIEASLPPVSGDLTRHTRLAPLPMPTGNKAKSTLIKQSEQNLDQPEIHAPALKRDGAIAVYPRLRGGTPWKNFEDGVENSDIAVASLNSDINDIALREQRLQTADDPTAGVQRQALGVEVDANEVPGPIGNFENESCDRYAVVLELALSDSPAEGSWVPRRSLCRGSISTPLGCWRHRIGTLVLLGQYQRQQQRAR